MVVKALLKLIASFLILWGVLVSLHTLSGTFVSMRELSEEINGKAFQTPITFAASILVGKAYFNQMINIHT